MSTITRDINELEAARLLHAAGFSRDEFTLCGFSGGRNNRVWRVEHESGPFLFKKYFRHPSDPRDRLVQETDFLWAMEGGGLKLPRVLAHCRQSGSALLTWIDGRPPRKETLNEQDLAAMIDFVRGINTPEARHSGSRLLPASEACLTPVQQLDVLGRRIHRWVTWTPVDEIDERLQSFLHHRLFPLWEVVQTKTLAESHTLNRPLTRAEQIISPSDFGFHNTLRGTQGELWFVDFEYAGWDDPAKLICDFCHQPDIMLPPAWCDRFRHSLISLSPSPESLASRLRLLEPLLLLKWACICLNVFSGPGQDRARFTEEGQPSRDDPRGEQLTKANVMLERALLSL